MPVNAHIPASERPMKRSLHRRAADREVDGCRGERVGEQRHEADGGVVAGEDLDELGGGERELHGGSLLENSVGASDQ